MPPRNWPCIRRLERWVKSCPRWGLAQSQSMRWLAWASDQDYYRIVRRYWRQRLPKLEFLEEMRQIWRVVRLWKWCLYWLERESGQGRRCTSMARLDWWVPSRVVQPQKVSMLQWQDEMEKGDEWEAQYLSEYRHQQECLVEFVKKIVMVRGLEPIESYHKIFI